MRRARVFSLPFALLISALLSTTITLAQSGGTYNLEWNTFDSGGASFSTSGPYSLGGTIGQSDAGKLTGGVFTLNGGFWGGAPGSPTAATLTRFNAKFAPNKNFVRVKWETGNELNVVGFNVWRKVGKGEWKLHNKEMITAKHVGSIEGAKYAVAHKKVKPGKTYQYKIEIVKANGESEWSEVKTVK